MKNEEIKQIEDSKKKANRLVIIGSRIAQQGCTYYKDFYAGELKHRVNILDTAAKNVNNIFLNNGKNSDDKREKMKEELKSNEIFLISEIVNYLSFFDEDSLENLLNEIKKW